MSVGATQRVRCAIYTRKSSEEGLEQGFNSLDAQREACAAYVLSQASEGWVALPDHYDDGGISGGTLERPALKRLMADVEAGHVDVIVVYKVDRLSRSLFDFAKLVEAFERAGTSFVSITQSFNTTSSMGRLTLNMLLSFAQFEREVTAERIRDKIAASKAKGMWMGGTPPLGYRPDGRSLAIVEEHAEIVRAIFQRYLRLGTVRLLANSLAEEGLYAPQRITSKGKSIGARPFSRGQLYLMLKCRTYLGEVQHRHEVYPGLHPAIIDRELWEAVQAGLRENVQGHRKVRAASPCILAGRIVDKNDVPLAVTHACKSDPSGTRRVRYRYYVTSGGPDSAMSTLRIPAREIETLVSSRLAEAFDDPLALLAQLGAEPPAERIVEIDRHCRAHATALRQRDRHAVDQVLALVKVDDHGVMIHASTERISALLAISLPAGAPPTLALVSAARLTRSGRAMRLVRPNGGSSSTDADTSLVRLVARARSWWRELRCGKHTITTLAAEERVSPAYMTRVVRLAFLSPRAVEAILAGRTRTGVTAASLTLQSWPDDWREQARLLLPNDVA